MTLTSETFAPLPKLSNAEHEHYANLIALEGKTRPQAYQEIRGEVKNASKLAANWHRRPDVSDRIKELELSASIDPDDPASVRGAAVRIYEFAIEGDEVLDKHGAQTGERKRNLAVAWSVVKGLEPRTAAFAHIDPNEVDISDFTPDALLELTERSAASFGKRLVDVDAIHVVKPTGTEAD